MKAIVITIIAALLSIAAQAQPQARRKANTATKSNADNLTTRAQISFPTALKMDEDVVWRRDVYREIDLKQGANAGLYYPVEPTDGRVNLFTYIFKLVLTGNIKAYEYKLDGNESFEDSARVKPLALLDNYHIYYERVNGRIRLDNSDIPSREVTAYYLKESAYYDQANAAFHRRVIALCPIMKREDDFGDAPTAYPLFWVKYDDLEPFLAKQTVMTSDVNNAATMTLDDFFNLNKYQGKIYKTNNMLGLTLAQYCKNDSDLTREQKRIEEEITAFEKNVWGSPEKKDSLDSQPMTDKEKKAAQKAEKATRKSRRAAASSSKKSSTSRKSSAGTSKSSSPRVSVRRERH